MYMYWFSYSCFNVLAPFNFRHTKRVSVIIPVQCHVVSSMVV